MKQLEMEYETDIEKGLTTGEVKRRLAENRFVYLTKEKKRSWLQSAKQESLDPLFFFLIFLCAFFLIIKEKMGVLTFFVVIIICIFKYRQTVRNQRFIQKRREMFLPMVQVLRDGIYKSIDVREIVIGDILRLKKGQEIPAAVRSLRYPDTVYAKGETFQEQSGKAIAVAISNSTTLKKKGMFARILSESEAVPLRRQEFLFHHGIISMEKSKVLLKKEKIVILDTEFFPSGHHLLHIKTLAQELAKRRIPLVLFTEKDKYEAGVLLENAGIIKGQRNIVDEAQFSCYSKEIFDCQIKSISVYCGLNKEEKRRVVEGWEGKGKKIYLAVNKESDETEEYRQMQQENKVVLMSPFSSEADYFFTIHWADGIKNLLRGEELWQYYEETTMLIQDKTLFSLCIFNGMMLLGGIMGASVQSLRWMFILSAVVCGGLAVFREILWIWLCRNFQE